MRAHHRAHCNYYLDDKGRGASDASGDGIRPILLSQGCFLEPNSPCTQRRGI
jgi:hypothetical protein